MRRAALLVLFAGVMFATTARAEFYQWTDSDGRQFYTNDLAKVPAQYRDTAKQVEVHDDRVSVSGGGEGKSPSRVREPERKDKYGKGESYWRKRAENLRRQIREQQDQHDRLAEQQREAEDHPTKSEKSAKKARADREKKMHAIEKKIASLRNELDVQLPEEARKADAYPGWLRE